MVTVSMVATVSGLPAVCVLQRRLQEHPSACPRALPQPVGGGVYVHSPGSTDMVAVMLCDMGGQMENVHALAPDSSHTP